MLKNTLKKRKRILSVMLSTMIVFNSAIVFAEEINLNPIKPLEVEEVEKEIYNEEEKPESKDKSSTNTNMAIDPDKLTGFDENNSESIYDKEIESSNFKDGKSDEERQKELDKELQDAMNDFLNSDNEDYNTVGEKPQQPQFPVYDDTEDFSDFVFNNNPNKTNKGSSRPSYNTESFDLINVGDSGYSSNDYPGLAELGESPKKEHEPGEDFLKTRPTIQYTFDVDGEYPIYTDTGISANEEGFVHVEGMTELFNQFAILKNGKVVEDIDKIMLVIDGEVLIAKAGETKIEELIKMFDNFPVKVKEDYSRAGGRFDLVEILETTGELPVEINTQRINLVSKPKIKNQRVHFPIRSIVENMDGEVEWNSETRIATVKKGDVVIKLKGDSDVVNINGEEYLISSPTFIDNTEMRMLSLINLLVTELGGEMFYDAQLGGLVIETPEGMEELNDW